MILWPKIKGQSFYQIDSTAPNTQYCAYDTFPVFRSKQTVNDIHGKFDFKSQRLSEGKQSIHSYVNVVR